MKQPRMSLLLSILLMSSYVAYAARVQLQKLHARALSARQLAPVSGKDKELCHAKLNIVFVLDGSGSIRRKEWKIVKDFVTGLSLRFELNSDTSRVSVIQFSKGVKLHCRFDEEGSNFRDLADCVNNIKQMKLTTRSDLGLQLAKEVLQDELDKNPSPPIDGQLVIFLGDGDADDAAVAAAQEIIKMHEKSFIFSLAVGLGADVPMLKRLASPSVGEHEFFFRIEQFDDLEKIVEPLLYVGCDSEVLGKPVGLGRGMLGIDSNVDANLETDLGAKVKGEQCGNNCLNDVYYGVFRDGRQISEGFYDVADRWRLVATLGQQLYHQTNSKVMSKFTNTMRAKMEEILVQAVKDDRDPELLEKIQELKATHSDSDFILKFSPLLLQASQNANVMEGYELISEMRSMKDEGLTIDLQHKSDALDILRTKLAARMLSFIHNAHEVETSFPVFTPAMIEMMWSAWQNAWGTVRIYVKLTTQCKVDVPPAFPIGKTAKEKRSAFMNKQFEPLWSQCKKAAPFDREEFPSAVVACARQDEVEESHVKNRDNLIRYLGCGSERREEPPVYDGPKTMCSIDKKNRVWNGILCNMGSLSDGSCNLFGPFWSVYSAKTDRLFGWKTEAEMKQQHYSKNHCQMASTVKRNGELLPYADISMCGTPQVEGFKSMINDASMKYIYGNVPDIPTSLAAEHNHPGTKHVGWKEGGQLWNQPHDRPRDPAVGEVLREVRRGSTVVLLAYGYSGAGKTTTLVGDNGAGIDGVVSLYLKEMSRYIRDVDFSSFEVYGRMSAIDGSMVPDVGQGVWAYEPKEGVGTTDIHFLGDWNEFHTDDHVDFEKVSTKLGQYKISMGNVLFNGVPDEEQDWAFDIQRLLAEIENLRRDQKKFNQATSNPHAVPQAHIRGTPNNPSSSRGTLFVTLDILFKDGKKGSIAVVDLAGAEDPAVMAASFLKFMPKPATEYKAWTTESYTQRIMAQDVCNGKLSNMELIRKYLRSMNDHKAMDGFLSECLALKEVLVECKEHVDEMPPDCAKTMIHGDVKYYRPNIATSDAPEPDWIRKSFREETQKFRNFEYRWQVQHMKQTDIVGEWTIDEVLEALNGGSAGEGSLDKVSYKALGVLGWNNENTPGKPHNIPGRLSHCDDEFETEVEYKSFGRMHNARNGNRRCAIGSCQTIKLVDPKVIRESKRADFGKTLTVNADLQLERVDLDLKTGEKTGIDWRLNRCLKGSRKYGTCSMVNNQPSAEISYKAYDPGTDACNWPDRLWHSKPYQIEELFFNPVNSTRKTTPPYERYFKIVTQGPENQREQNELRSIGGDMIGKGKDRAKLNYDSFLQNLKGQKGVTDEQIRERKEMRTDFWLKLQEYLDEYKLYEEEYRRKWDIHMAYFTQTIGPMIEEALYINEMLNQMRNFLKSVSDWSENRVEKDPWPQSSVAAKMGDPLGAVQGITRTGVKPYNKAEYVREEAADLPYYKEVQLSGKDRVLGLTMLEAIRRKATHAGPENYKVLFGAFLRTDKPNGDPDCQGARQSLEFAQLLTESMGMHRKDYLPVLLGPQAASGGGIPKSPEGDGFDFSQFAVNVTAV